MQREMRALDYLPEGTGLAGVSYQGHLLFLEWPAGKMRYENRARERASNFTSSTPIGGGQCYALAVARDERRLAVTGNGWAEVWSLVDGVLEQRFPRQPCNMFAVAISPDGQYVLTGSSTGLLQLFEIESANCCGVSMATPA